MGKEDLELTILMPCLNEAETIEICIKKAKKSLAEKYTEQKEKTFTKRKTPAKNIKKSKSSKKQVYTMKSQNDKNGLPIYWIIVGISFIIAMITIISIIL